MLKNKYRAYAENLLFALNIFIIFLLLFGDAIAIPQWLQPVGRLHPVILHFPIVVLIIAALMEFFRFNDRLKYEPVYQELTDYLWLGGALFAAITAIMGIFLSKEPGYDGDTVQWHKWFGAMVVFIATAIYLGRGKGWYKAKIAQASSIGVALCLLMAGHYGADITHGENFILAPVWHPERAKVPIDKAVVFNDVVEPIFQDKCISCHNPGKTKGGLNLTDEQSILKGGKDGKLFVAGQPQISLLLQRLHMPEGEKKHMPPAGKPQLTEEELTLLYQWVKENSVFNKKVIDLPPTDSLRLAAATFLKPAEEAEEQYDFAAADDKLIKKLNNNYRVIYPIAQGSPALGVNIYNKSTYQPKVLEELSSIKKQVVSLDLNKMPVKNAELKTIAGFENLRSLNLNFSEVTGSTLNQLAALKHLKTLSLAGTPINAQAAKQISAIKSLEKIALWDTGLSDAEIAALQKENKNVDFIKGFKDDGKAIQLNVPQVKNPVFVFTKPVELQLSHPIKGVEIRYTTDGKDPDSLNSAVYKPGIVISQNTFIKAKAYKAGWFGSDMIQASFYKSAYTPDSISFIAGPNERYTGDGAKTLIDKDLGGGNFGNGKWVASQKDMIVYMQFNSPVSLHTVTLNCMRNTGSQIFFPVEIQVWGGADDSHMRLLGQVKPAYPKKDDPFIVNGVDCALAANRPVSCLKIVVKPVAQLPAWFKVKKPQPGWVFMDEIFLN